MPALQASCSIPFVLQAVHDIPGAPRGAYWDGGITDYHLHLNYAAQRGRQCRPGAVPALPESRGARLAGQGLKWRHGATHFLDNMVVLAPDPEWVRTCPTASCPTAPTSRATARPGREGLE
jgi:hypothetical protein